MPDIASFQPGQVSDDVVISLASFGGLLYVTMRL
jgi:hypothetical protein